MGRVLMLLYTRRVLNADRINQIANDPSVRPWMGGEGELDLSAAVGDSANITFLSNEDNGAYLCHKTGDGVYEVHSMFLPSGRGGYAVDCMREALRFMFCATDCVELRTRIPDNNEMAKGIGKVAGFQEIFRRDNYWPSPEGLIGCSHQSMSLDVWRGRDTDIRQHGELFHEKLEAAKIEMGSPLPVHDEDEAHDRAVGASMLMALNGNPRKAVWAYNRWAIFAGYAPISLLSDAPVLVDVVDAIVAPKGGEMEIVLCRSQPSPPSRAPV